MYNIDLLRKEMKKHNIDACIVPTADPHLSEYIPDCYKLRQWLCGFTGSAGELVVTKNDSGLWTDGRYYIQAEMELSGSETKLYKASEKETIKIHEYLVNRLNKNDRVGIDGKMFSKSSADFLEKKLRKKGIVLVNDFDPSVIWGNRPPQPQGKAFILEKKYAGESAQSKINRIRSKMAEDKADYFIVSSLEEVMWLLNIRGNDISYTPVMLCYFMLGKKDAFLYVDKEKLTENVKEYLTKIGVNVKNYNDIYYDVKKLGKRETAVIDFSKTNSFLISSVKCAVNDKKSYIDIMKCIKNPVEIENIKKAYIKENVALIKSFYEIYNSEKLTECTVSDIIEKNRKSQENYISPSFETIAAYGKNAAMMHYSPDRENDVEIKQSGMLLIDTGAQFLEGTTDTTRTLILGDITEEEAENYTLVLKGNIALASAVFPYKTRCCELDALARNALWKKGLDYRCSTGHGVGHVLGVHEGPVRISALCDLVLKEGMTVTDEPGVYKEDCYGIRIENHLFVKEKNNTEYGKFLCFEPLNYCPIGTEYLIKGLLTEEEICYINDYNKKVAELYKEKMTEEEYQWLKNYARKI